MNMEELPPVLTVKRAGELLGLGRGSAYRAAARGELPTLRFGRRLVVPTAKLLGLLGFDLRGTVGEDEPGDDPGTNG